MKKTIFKLTVGLLAALLVGTLASWFAFVPGAREPAYVFVASWGEKGSNPGQFADPTGLAIADNELFVSDARNGRIQVFDFDGKFRRTFGKTGTAPGELGRPMNLSVRGDELFVAEYFNDRIQVFSLRGSSRRIIGSPGAGRGQFNSPGGVAVAADGAIYVADFYNHRVQKLGAAGTFKRQWGNSVNGERGSGLLSAMSKGKDVSFSYPTDVAIAQDGRLYVADGYNDRVQVFHKDGTFSHRWGGPFAMNINGPFNGWFSTVTGIAIGPDGNIFVADFYNHRIQKFTAEGIFLTSFGKQGSGPAAFTHPIAIAIAPNGTVFVADYGNNRITKWRRR